MLYLLGFTLIAIWGLLHIGSLLAVLSVPVMLVCALVEGCSKLLRKACT